MVIAITAIAGLLGHSGFFDNLKPYTAFAFTFAYFGLPSLYLLFRKPDNAKSGLIGGVVVGLLLGLPFDFVATFAHAWVFNPEFLRFPHSIFGVAHLDEVIWFFFWAAFAIIFYEHFFEHHKKWRVSKHVHVLVVFGIAVNVVVFGIFFMNAPLLMLPYAYLILGLCATAPIVVALFLHPRLLYKMVYLSLFFVPAYFFFEYIALGHAWWVFNGQYIGGGFLEANYLPLEEILFWIILGAATVVAYHELFLDDGK